MVTNLDIETTPTLYEGSMRVGNEQIKLRLYKQTAGVAVLDRQVVRVDGATFTQIIGIADSETLYDFATADPYANKLQLHYDLIQHRYAAAREGDFALREPDISGDPVRTIHQIADCRSEGELLTVARSVIASLGGGDFIYQWLQFDERTPGIVDMVDSRYLVGCRASWMQQYIANVWFMNDPMVQYAQNFAAPTVSSRIDVHRTDHWFFTEAYDHGLYNGVIAPAHLRINGPIGLLYVSAPHAHEHAEEHLWKNRVLLRALSCEILDWRVAQNRRLASATYNLDAREIIALETLRRGGRAMHVAKALNLSLNTVYKSTYERIKTKMAVAHINEAVTKAVELRIIGY